MVKRVSVAAILAVWSFAGAMDDVKSQAIINHLCAAAKGNWVSIINDMYKEVGPEIINGHDEHGLTPLHYAAFGGRFATVVELLNRGANPTIRGKKVDGSNNDIQFYEPLHMAAFGNKLYFESLLNKNYTETLSNRGFADIFDWYSEIAQLLINAGASPATSHEDHFSAYQIARNFSQNWVLAQVLALNGGCAADVWAKEKVIMRKTFAPGDLSSSGDE